MSESDWLAARFPDVYRSALDLSDMSDAMNDQMADRWSHARRATATLRDLGLLSWQTRLIRTEWRAEQTSNQYQLVVQETFPLPSPRCGGQTVRETHFRLIPDDAAAQANAVRQLIALGASVPVSWQQDGC